MDALGTFIREKPSGCLYHYTGADGLIGVVENRNLRATDYRHLNDRKEHRIGARMLQEEVRTSGLADNHRDAFERLVANTQKGYFVLSFSESEDQLSQWRAYCPGGSGYALGFEQKNDLFSLAEQHSFNLIRCVYDRSKQRSLCKYLVDSFTEGMVTRQSWWSGKDVASRARAFFERYEWNLALALVMSALKHKGFEEEREWRLVSQYPNDGLYGVSFRPGRFGVTPFFELPIAAEEGPWRIDEITIGPTANRAAARSALDLLLSRNQAIAGRINLSRTPLRH
jgi:hypothetical protein